MSTTTASTTTSPRSNGLNTRSRHDHSTWIGNGDVAVGQRDLDHPQLRSAALAGVGDADQALPLTAMVGPELVPIGVGRDRPAPRWMVALRVAQRRRDRTGVAWHLPRHRRAGANRVD